MKYFPLILVLCSELLYQSVIGEKYDSQKFLFKQTSFDTYNEVYNQENNSFEDPIQKNADCKCENGNCVNEGGKDVCKCFPGYGNYTNTYCKACDCGPNKSCIFIDKSWFKIEKVCLCNPGYIEDNGNCVECDCKNGKCRVTSDNNILCECLPEYGKRSEVCEACECGTGANCTWESGFGGFSGTKYCLCPDGSRLKEKHCGDLCSSNPCQNGGTCSVDGQDFKCSCKSPYEGRLCEADPCSLNPCKNGGTCTVDGQGFKCFCKKPFTGNMCEKDPCSFNPCRNGGTCTVDGQGFICLCKIQFTGKLCETDPCSLNPCQNGGTCTVDWYGFKCFCKKPFTGNQCETGPCMPNPCKNNGRCEIDEQGFRCTCKSYWQGKTCDNAICNDDICIHGKCEVFGHYHRCRCDKGYTGFRCEDKIETISDKQAVWLFIQSSILFSILILLSGMFFIYLRRKK